MENFAQKWSPASYGSYSNLFRHVNNPRPVSTLMGLIRRVQKHITWDVGWLWSQCPSSCSQLSIRVSKKNLDNVGRDEEVDARKSIIPKIHTNAKTYYFLSSLTLKDIHEPPALKHLLNKEIEAFQQHKLNLEHPCHNQAVERHIKLVSEASAAVAGSKNKNGLTRQKIISRKLIKTFDTKTQFDA